jgi:hypothetical protein
MVDDVVDAMHYFDLDENTTTVEEITLFDAQYDQLVELFDDEYDVLNNVVRLQAS